MSAVRAAAAESIMLSDEPMTTSALCTSVKSKLSASLTDIAVDLGSCMLLAKPLLGPSPSARFNPDKEILQSVVKQHRMKRAKLSKCDASAAVDATVQTLVQGLLVMDQHFCISPGNFCMYPCLPSMIAQFSDFDSVIGAALRDPGLVARWPYDQYRRRLSYLIRTSQHSCFSSMMRLGVSSPAPSTPHGWLEKWKQIMILQPNRSIAFNSTAQMARSAIQVQLNLDVQRPIAHGFMTAPISIKSLENMLGYHTFTIMSRRMSFRNWLQLGILGPSAKSFLNRALWERAVDRSMIPLAATAGRGTEGKLMDEAAQRMWRQLLSNESYKAAKTPNGLLDLKLCGDLRVSNGGLPASLLVLSPRDLVTSASAAGQELDDKDVFVVSVSRDTFGVSVLQVIKELEKRARGSDAAEDGSRSAVWVAVKDLCRAVMWTHEHGEVVAVRWMVEYLSQFRRLVKLSPDQAHVARR